MSSSTNTSGRSPGGYADLDRAAGTAAALALELAARTERERRLPEELLRVLRSGG